MIGASDQQTSRKGLIPFDPDWQRLTRDDIYRQRVYGTESGASDFIPINDKRKLSLLSMVVYVIFIVATTRYVTPRVPVQEKYQVNSAIRTSLMTSSYETDPRPLVWDDIESVQDLRSWLLNAFPGFLMPAVQGFNFPVGAARFTLRRMQQTPNDDERFNSIAPVIWKNKNGIALYDTSTDHDDMRPFGAYREWDRLSLHWEERDGLRCDGGELLDLVEEVRYDQETVVKKCKDWCEGLFADSKPCRCWTLSGRFKCEFYYMPEKEALQNYSTSSLAHGVPVSSAELAPRVKPGGLDTTVYWPRMKVFTYSGQKTGWRETAGFVMHLDVYPQETITATALAAQDRFPVPLTQSQLVFNQVRDWIEGGLLSRSVAGLTIDFVTYNPNYQVFTWVQLGFQVEASGHILKTMELSSLRITQEDREDKDVSMWRDLNFWDVLYIGLVIVYIMWEFWELGQRGVKYFYFGWNWLTIVSLVLHICTLVSRYVYLNKADFTKILINMSETSYQPDSQEKSRWTTAFGAQAVAFHDFKLFSSLNLLFVWLQLVHYLNDNVQRIGVLVDTMHRSMTPIVFLVVIVADMFTGFAIWANLMFGKSVGAFKDFWESVYSCTELLFGQVDSYYALRPVYPVSGIVFFFTYMFTFNIVLQNLSKAIILVSYDDACGGHERAKVHEENRRRAVESDSSSDCLAKRWKQVHLHVKRFFGKVDRVNSYEAARMAKRLEQRRAGYERSSICLFLVFCVMYVVMTWQQVQVSSANTLTTSLSSAITTPVFEKVSAISGQVSSNNNFSSIETRDDVMMFLTQVLPTAMFNSSAGTFETEPNPLKIYQSALPVEYRQLVINNWNILVGRTHPVRISTRLASMTKVGDARVGSLVTADTLKTASCSLSHHQARQFDPPLDEATGLQQVLNPKARGFLERHECLYTLAYGSEESANGFACMLSRDYETAMAMLQDMQESEFITNQTAMVAVDFVVYNGYAEAFVYVAIAFGFQPSGAIIKDIRMSTIRLDLYNSGSVLRAIFEVAIILITCFYLGQSFRNLYHDVVEFRKESKDPRVPQTCLQRTLSILQAVAFHFIWDPFNLLDLLSSCMTVVTMVLWYNVVLMKLRDFYFPEIPVWSDAELSNSIWKSDSAVISEFYLAGRSIEWFARICAVNTVMLLLRLLKYLQLFPRVRMMFKTLGRGAKDIFYFIIVMFVILMGYVTMGHQIYGALTYDFATLGNSVVSCFEMFLGTFNYNQLRQTDALQQLIYCYTYVILFRYMLINMFFAIVDKGFQEEDREREKLELELLEQQRRQRSAPREGSALARGLHSLKFSLGGRGGSQGKGEGAQGEHDDEFRVPGEGERAGAHSSAPSEGAPANPEMTVGEDEQRESTEELSQPGEAEAAADDAITEGTVKRVRNWQHLPPDMRRWALDTSKEIYSFIDELQKKRAECVQNREQYELERILEDAETAIKDKRQEARKEALEMKKDLEDEELRTLKEIHQDQEALAWYIMKREAELKKLEQAKERKQERFDEIVQAAKSLISSGDGDGAAALEDRK